MTSGWCGEAHGWVKAYATVLSISLPPGDAFWESECVKETVERLNKVMLLGKPRTPDHQPQSSKKDAISLNREARVHDVLYSLMLNSCY